VSLSSGLADSEWLALATVHFLLVRGSSFTDKVVRRSYWAFIFYASLGFSFTFLIGLTRLMLKQQLARDMEDSHLCRHRTHIALLRPPNYAYKPRSTSELLGLTEKRT
jgi:hypothetical protein